MRLKIAVLCAVVLLTAACSASVKGSVTSSTGSSTSGVHVGSNSPSPTSSTDLGSAEPSVPITSAPSISAPIGSTAPSPLTRTAPPANLVALMLPLWQIPARPVNNLDAVRWHWTGDSMSVLSDHEGFVVTRSPSYELVDTTSGEPAVYTDAAVDSSAGPATLRHTVNKAIWPGEISPSSWWITWPISAGQYVHLALPFSNGSKSTWDWRVAAVKTQPTTMPRTLDLLRAPSGFQVVDESDEFNPGGSGVSPMITLCPRGFADVSSARTEPTQHGCIQVGAYRAGQDPFGRIPQSQFVSSVVNGRQLQVDAADERAVQLQRNGSIVVVADPSIGLTESDLAGIAASATADPKFLASRGGSAPPPVIAGSSGVHSSPPITQAHQQVYFPVTPSMMPADLHIASWSVRVDQFEMTYQAAASGRMAQIGSSEPIFAVPAGGTASGSGNAPGSGGTSLPPNPWKTQEVTLSGGRVVYVSVSSGAQQELEQIAAGIQDKPFPLPSSIGVQQGVVGYGSMFGAGVGRTSGDEWTSMCPTGIAAGDEVVFEVPQSPRCISIQLARHQDYGGNRNSSFGGSPPGSVIGIARPGGPMMFAVVDIDRTVAVVQIGKDLWLTLALPSLGGVSDVTQYLSILGTAKFAAT